LAVRRGKKGEAEKEKDGLKKYLRTLISENVKIKALNKASLKNIC